MKETLSSWCWLFHCRPQNFAHISPKDRIRREDWLTSISLLVEKSSKMVTLRRLYPTRRLCLIQFYVLYFKSNELFLSISGWAIFYKQVSISRQNFTFIKEFVRDLVQSAWLSYSRWNIIIFIDIRFFRESQILKYFFSIVLIIFRTLVWGFSFYFPFPSTCVEIQSYGHS